MISRFVFSFLFLCPLIFHAQVYTLDWKTAINEWTSPTNIIKKPFFKGASYLTTEQVIPFKVVHIPLSDNETINSINLYNVSYQAISSENEKLLSEEHFDNAQIKWDIISSRGKRFIEIYVPAIQKINGSAMEITSFELQVSKNQSYSSRSNNRFSTKSTLTSPLSSGAWYKLRINKDAVFQITYSDLSDMGINVDNIDPRKIQIWGNGVGILPEEIKAGDKLTLQEIPIEVIGENDGTFNSADQIIFFGKGPNEISYDPIEKFVNYNYNPYDNYSYYFLTIGSSNGKRIQDHTNYVPDGEINSRIEIHHNENNVINLIKTGRQYFGDYFDITTQRNYNFNLSSLSAGKSTKIQLRAAVRSFTSAGNSFSVSINNSSIGTETTPAVSPGYTNLYAQILELNAETSVSGSINMQVTYNKPASSSIAWLDYITINQPTPLSFTNGSQLFFNPVEEANYSISKYNIQSSSNIQVWDVTNGASPLKCPTVYENGATSFSIPTDSLKLFIAHNYTNLSKPDFLGSISNQNLFGLLNHEYILITPEAFKSAGVDLVNFHISENGYTAAVVDIEDIYNQFGSGKKDISAIRNFIRFLYDNASNENDRVKYVMLLGDGSYDYDRGNYIPTYQSENSLAPITSFASDDYIGILEPGESILQNATRVDVAIGRFPAKSLAEAQAFVNKVRNYSRSATSVSVGNYNIPSNFGDWKNNVFFVADDGNDADNYDSSHLTESEYLLNNIQSRDSSINNLKTYMDAFPKESSAGGGRYPLVEEEIESKVHEGAYIVSYIGHGGEAGWADERILGVSDINGWTNKDKLPLFLTATCEFSRFDDPDRVSAGEYVILSSNGGAIAMLTTIRLVFGGISNNIGFSDNYFEGLFSANNNEYGTFGDALLHAKVNSIIGSAYNSRKFALLGDPGLKSGIPKYVVNTLDITDFNENQLDTIKSGSRVRVTGNISDLSGNPVDFNGILFHTVYDKEQTRSTLDNNNKGSTLNFKTRESILFKGKSTVTNGEFSFSFIVPKDIDYTFDNGKISYYLANDQEDGNGHYFDFIVGGTDSSANNDNSPPKIELYLNDTTFVEGGLTNDEPIMIAYLSDDFGINTSGAGIGRNITVTIDDDYANSFVINDAYEANLNSFNSGSIQYQLSQLSPGIHKLTLKVWDVNNNSNEKSITFEVKASVELKLGRVFNYPNPFSTSTNFHFEHNQYTDQLDVHIKIFTISGKVVKTLESSIPGNQNLPLNNLHWDGKDDFGDDLGRGVYLYEITVRNPEGDTDKKIEKLVLLN